jgi:hypothetical protein
VPFDYYLKHCPQELKDLGLFNHMYDKFPRSLLLQKAAASLAADRLLDSQTGAGEKGASGIGKGLLRTRAALRWVGAASTWKTAQRDGERPSRRLLFVAGAPPTPSLKGSGLVAAPPMVKPDIFSGKATGRGELSHSMRDRANTEDV